MLKRRHTDRLTPLELQAALPFLGFAFRFGGRRLVVLLAILPLGIERVAKTVTDEVQREQSQNEHRGGEDDQPPVDPNRIQLLCALRDERAPACVRRLNAKPKIAEERFVKNNGRY